MYRNNDTGIILGDRLPPSHRIGTFIEVFPISIMSYYMAIQLFPLSAPQFCPRVYYIVPLIRIRSTAVRRDRKLTII
jgi:hypothetical protein